MNSSCDIDSFDKQCSNRANIYRLLADCFRYPELSLEPTLQSLPSELSSYHRTLRDGAESLAEHFKFSDSEIKNLQIEYSRLFIGPYHLEAPPYSSVYLDKQALVMGDATQQAIEFYIQAGLNPADENKEPPDHISTELEFMYYLLFQKVMRQDYQFFKLSNSFLEKHLYCWVPLFAHRIIKCTKNAFYLELARLLDAFIQKEKQP